MSRSNHPSPSAVRPAVPARERVKLLLTRAAVATAFAATLVVPIKYPEALGE
jgi:hypothetical protein